MEMVTTTVFKNGNSQAVRIPKDFRFKDDEVVINKMGDVVMLMPKNSRWASFILGLDLISDDFMEDGRGELRQQKREAL